MTSPAHDTVKTRPILFSGAMVRAILAGKKTQTRRVAKRREGQPAIAWEDVECPYGVPGDRLWVKETWCPLRKDYEAAPRSMKLPVDGDGVIPSYRADHSDSRGDGGPLEWRPSIFMPRWASRITLELQAVRIERLQAISAEDSLAEGVPRMSECGCEVCRRSAQICPADASEQIMGFAHLWDSINAKREGCSWADNPFVWCLAFKVVKP